MMKLPILTSLFLITFFILPSFADDGKLLPSPFFSVRDMDGKPHNLDEILESKKNIVLVFWQTWCAVCIREAPSLVKASQENIDSLQFFGIISGTDDDVDDAEVRKKAKKLKLPYPQIRDRDLSITIKYEVKGTPTIVILGPEKDVLYNSHHAPSDWSTFRNTSKSN